MYRLKDYYLRGTTFLGNNLRPRHKRLSTVMIYATDLCDSACKHCLIWAKRPPKFLSFDKIKEIVNSDCVTRNTTIGLEGGEFLLHPQAMDILGWLQANHPNFDLLSNCLKPEMTIKAVTDYTPKGLYISLDGTEETYKHMRGKDGYHKVVRVIEECRKKVPISVMFTLSPYNNYEDLNHVAHICKKYEVDLRVGIYNNISFFDTIEQAHDTNMGALRNEEPFKNINSLKNAKEKRSTANGTMQGISKNIPPIIKEFSENYDYLVLYDQWREKKLKLNCYSILDSVVVLPNGDVPICQNLDVMLGNVNNDTLDNIFNSKSTQQKHKFYTHHCNQCWINFHRKYDVVLYRNLERFFPKKMVEKMFGYYQWSEDKERKYNHVVKQEVV